MRWVVRLARMVVVRNAYKILVGKSQSKEPFGKYQFRWVDNIKMNHK
jgi:hypothetical protein